ncbi:OmpA family protein [Kribbella antibiotica]|uniref:OmpA family protein n=1 Tax=Kribbella antibiotica TaxID=190195 RepID=A0A4R4ZHF7_9ACTN|nr:OmpA family protein [Kribbella antibiotica]TDD56889.1 OmpA family protein [Kribbella antibiotica]
MSRLARRPVVWLLAALAVPVLLTAVLLPVKADSIENELRSNATAALTARGINGATVVMDGRDASVLVSTDVDATQIEAIVREVDGVRTVSVKSGSGTPAPPPTQDPGQTTPGFEIGRTDTAIRVQATVRSELAKDSIKTEVEKVLGPDREYDQRVTVDAANGIAEVHTLTALLHAMAIGTGDASVRYDGTTVTLSGAVPDQATKAMAARAAAQAVPGAVIADELKVPESTKPVVTEACRTFKSRLSEFGRQNKINFLSGTAIVNDASKQAVDRAATLLKTCASVRIEVTGHTDNLGSPATSLPLSEQRAAAVKAELVRLGIPAARLVATGYGQAFPIAPNDTATGRIANRRAELRALQEN